MTGLATASLFGMMLALGTTLRVADFRRLVARPRAVALGLAGQLALLPLVAFAIAHGLELAPTLAIGLVLLAACPGGATSNLFSLLAHGDVALSITLTAASSVVTFVTLPLLLSLALRTFGSDAPPLELPLARTTGALFGTTALPVLLGMALLHWRHALADRLRRPLLAVSASVLLVLIVGLGIATSTSERDIAGLAVRATPAVSLLLVISAAAGFAGARALRLGGAASRTLALEIGVQNVNLAFFVALSLLDDPLYAGAALVYLPVQLIAAGAIVAWARASRRRAPRVSDPDARRPESRCPRASRGPRRPRAPSERP